MPFEIRSRAESLEYSTLRIVCDEGRSVGTGFFFTFDLGEKRHSSVLITNKHVIDGMSVADFYFHTIDKSSKHHNKLDTVRYDNLQSFVIRHPNEKIDLCAILLTPVLNKFDSLGKELISQSFFEDNIFRTSGKRNIFNNLTSLETIHMTGYPNGLWDEVNNKPVTRRGITASNIYDDWKGQPDFMIDMACFPGSSGSPVYVFDENSFISSGSTISTPGGRLLLVGILHSGPIIKADGEVKIINTPTSTRTLVSTDLMMNLGIVVRAEMLDGIKQELLRIISTME